MKHLSNGDVLGRLLLLLLLTFHLACAFNNACERSSVESGAPLTNASRLEVDADRADALEQLDVDALLDAPTQLDRTRQSQSKRSLDRASSIAQQRVWRTNPLGQTAFLRHAASPSARFYFGAPNYSLRSRALHAPTFLILQKLRD